MDELKKRLKKAKIDRKELAAKISVPYMTLSGYLNEFVPMPDHIRAAIENILKEVETTQSIINKAVIDSGKQAIMDVMMRPVDKDVPTPNGIL